MQVYVLMQGYHGSKKSSVLGVYEYVGQVGPAYQALELEPDAYYFYEVVELDSKLADETPKVRVYLSEGDF